MNDNFKSHVNFERIKRWCIYVTSLYYNIQGFQLLGQLKKMDATDEKLAWRSRSLAIIISNFKEYKCERFYGANLFKQAR